MCIYIWILISYWPQFPNIFFDWSVTPKKQMWTRSPRWFKLSGVTITVKKSLKHLQACRNPNCFFSSNISNWLPPPAKEGCFVRPIWAGALLARRATVVHSPAFRSNFQYNPNHRFKTAQILFYQSFSSCPSQRRQNTWLHFFQPSPTQPRSLHSHLDTV